MRYLETDEELLVEVLQHDLGTFVKDGVLLDAWVDSFEGICGFYGGFEMLQCLRFFAGTIQCGSALAMEQRNVVWRFDPDRL